MNKSDFPIIAVIVFYLLLILAFHLGCAWMGYPIYRSQHLGTALIYAHDGIDLLQPVIPGFTANGAPTPQEVPLWQAATALAFRICGEWYGWASVVSWLFLLLSLPPLFWLARAWSDDNTALWALLFFVAQPLVFFVGAAAGADGFCLMLALWFLFFTDRHLRTGSAGAWLGAAIFGALAVTCKAPFFMTAGIASAGMLVILTPRSLPRWLSLAGIGLAAAATLAVWNRYCNLCYAEAEFPLTELRMALNSDIVKWYFGTWAERFDPMNWGKCGWRILHAIFGSWSMAGLALVGFFLPSGRLSRWWLLGGLCSILVFFHIVVVAAHRHYYLMLSPAFALLCAVCIMWVQTYCAGLDATRRRLLFIALLTGMVLSTLQGFFGMERHIQFDRHPRRLATLIQEYVAPGEKMVLRGLEWGDRLYLLSERQGLSIEAMDILEDEGNVTRLKKKGYGKLVVVNEPPLWAAFQRTNLGESDRSRILYAKNLPPAIAAWSTVYEDEDVVIKRFP